MSAKHYAWITDPHLNYLELPELFTFFESIGQCDGVFITGDISTGKLIQSHIKLLEKVARKPIYFILGNHDYYDSDFKTVRDSVIGLSNEFNNLKYLTVSKPISLSDSVGLIGHDGWYDGRWVDPLTWLVFWYDWMFIKDFRSLKSNIARVEMFREQAYQASIFIADSLKKSLQTHSTVYLLTHFPPWPDNRPSWKNITDRFWNPYNSSKIIADAIEEVMERFQEKKLIVLAGHTHIKRDEQITSNITLRVGAAKCGYPSIQDIIII